MATRLSILAAALTIAAAAAFAQARQQPSITNATVTSQPAASPLAESFRSLAKATADVAWIGYYAPTAGEGRMACCDTDDCCASCRLEPGDERRPQRGTSSSRSGPIQLEGSDRMIVLFRIAQRSVERVRFFSSDCELDAGGRPVIWLENVRPAESVALLESLVQPARQERDRVSNGAIAAIAMHRDPSADASLERLASATQPESVRKNVAFWLGQARGERGLARLRLMLREDPSAAVRKRAVFGVSQSAAPGALEELLSIARSHSEPAVRSEAIFWLGQKAGAKVAAAITESIERDPDTDVKKRAVFALSQFPKDEGVPLLIEVARKNSNPVVRKQAMFWLAQSRDPRAIDFFAEILK